MVPQVKAFSSCRSGRRLGATTGLSLLNHFTEPGAVTRPRPGGRLVTGVARRPAISRASVLALFPPAPDLPRGVHVCPGVHVCLGVHRCLGAHAAPRCFFSQLEAGCRLCSGAAPVPGPSMRRGESGFQGHPSCCLPRGEPWACVRRREEGYWAGGTQVGVWPCFRLFENEDTVPLVAGVGTNGRP